MPLTGFGAGAFASPTYDGGFVQLRVIKALAPVPEPETYALMLAGVGMVAWAVKGKRRQRKRPEAATKRA
ncbi:MAG: PEP-CTERM sorting domain-containing protein [Burkholderiales bacterium]